MLKHLYQIRNYNYRNKMKTFQDYKLKQLKQQKQIIVEGKNIDNLYHITGLYGLYGIISDNFMRSHYSGSKNDINRNNNMYKWFISFSRTSNFQLYNWTTEKSYAKIVIDGKKLSNKYKIEPFNFTWSKNEYFNSTNKESEERIWFKTSTNGIKNIKSYIKYIIINVNLRHYIDISKSDVTKYAGYALSFIEDSLSQIENTRVTITSSNDIKRWLKYKGINDVKISK